MDVARAGTPHHRPAWATEPNLKRLILVPALRQVHIIHQFYGAGRSSIEIGAEMGISKHAIRTLLVRVRRALGITTASSPSTTMLRGARLHLPSEKHNQFASGFHVEARPRLLRSKGRHYHPVIDEERLRDLLVGPSLQRYQIACSYWIHGMTRRQIAERLNMTRRAVDFQLHLITRRAENPYLEPRVPTGMRTRAHKY